MFVDDNLTEDLPDVDYKTIMQQGGRMRELKFRAWNTVRNCWTSRVELDGGWGKPMFLHGEIENDSGYQTDNTIIEQYTGLRDKNGKEIYEGDTIAYDYGFGTYVVTYRRYDASFVLEDDKREEVLELALAGHPFYEVIGNIHENPELLEEQ